MGAASRGGAVGPPGTIPGGGEGVPLRAACGLKSMTPEVTQHMPLSEPTEVATNQPAQDNNNCSRSPEAQESEIKVSAGQTPSEAQREALSCLFQLLGAAAALGSGPPPSASASCSYPLCPRGHSWWIEGDPSPAQSRLSPSRNCMICKDFISK